MGGWIQAHARPLLLVAGVLVAVPGWVIINAQTNGRSVDLTQGRDCGNAVNAGLRYDAGPPACLWSAYSAGTPAHAAITSYTIEGDPMTFIVGIRSSDQISIHITSRDRYGPRGAFD